MEFQLNVCTYMSNVLNRNKEHAWDIDNCAWTAEENRHVKRCKAAHSSVPDELWYLAIPTTVVMLLWLQFDWYKVYMYFADWKETVAGRNQSTKGWTKCHRWLKWYQWIYIYFVLSFNNEYYTNSVNLV